MLPRRMDLVVLIYLATVFPKRLDGIVTVLVQVGPGEELVRVGRGCGDGVAAFGVGIPASENAVLHVLPALGGFAECVEDRRHCAAGRNAVLHDGAGRELEVKRDVAINVLQEAGCRT